MQATPSSTLQQKLAAAAEFVVDNFTKTHYQHKDNIDVEKGIYDCDCNGFAAFVLQKVALAQYNMIPRETTQKRPRAFEYYVFFSSPDLEAKGGWHRIHALKNARRGDILAWRFSAVEPGKDTGHVVVLAETPHMLDSGKWAVRVYDSAAGPHFEDVRTAESNGVGTGFVNFEVDEDGAPIAFQFGPHKSFEHFPIAIGRVEPL